MTYDDWLAHNPDDNFTEKCTCLFCGEELPDGKSFCDINCRIGLDND